MDKELELELKRKRQILANELAQVRRNINDLQKELEAVEQIMENNLVIDKKGFETEEIRTNKDNIKKQQIILDQLISSIRTN